MRVFSMGELWAGGDGMDCEATKGCKQRAWDIILTDEENESLPEDKQPLFIFQNKLGVATCDNCQTQEALK